MAAGNEILFGRIAVHNGLVSLSRLQDCIDIQRSRARHKHLAQILIEQGLLSESQARAVLLTQRRNLGQDRPGRMVEEAKVLDHLTGQGVVSRRDAEKALEFQRNENARGLYPAIGDILVQMGLAALDHVSQAQKAVGRRALWCSACGKKYRVVGYRPDKPVNCRKCGSVLVVQEPTSRAFEPDAPGAPDDERSEDETSLFAAEDISMLAPARVPVQEESLDVVVPSAMMSVPRVSYRPRVGDMLGGCRLEERIGAGGMGEIHRGRHLALQRDVAIKTLPARMMAQPHIVQRFLSEARAAARLTHPNIVTVHNVGEERGIYYIVMQHVKGRSIKDALFDSGPFDPAETLPIIRQAALGLAYAHRERIVHRDIKSANLMLSPDGHLTIVDFGLTKDFASEVSGLTSDGIVVGTVQYMSPEQTDGAAIDGRSDLYSLGITWFEMLTGRVPFTGETPWAIMIKQQRDEAPNVLALRPSVPTEMAKVVAKLLRKNPADRYRTGDELVAAIDGLAAKASAG